MYKRQAGIPGALVATLGCILPSCLIVTLIASFYLKYRNLSVFQSVLATPVSYTHLGLILTVSHKEQIGELYPQVLEALVYGACRELFE